MLPAALGFLGRRSLDWRWQRAQLLFRCKKRATPRRDDGVVREALRLLRATAGDLSSMRLSSLGRSHRLIAQAVQLHQAQERRTPCLLEAYLLAGASIEMIEVRLGLTAAVVLRYHDLFFDVQDRLQARDFLAAHIRGSRKHHQQIAANSEYLLKQYALIGGPLVVDDVAEHLGLLPVSPSSAGAQCSPDLGDRKRFLQIRVALLAHLLPDDVSPDQLLVLQSLWSECQGVGEGSSVQAIVPDAHGGQPGHALDERTACADGEPLRRAC